MPADLVLHSSSEMPPAQAHKGDPRGANVAHAEGAGGQPFGAQRLDHRIIMDELAQRDNFMVEDDDDDDEDNGQGAEGIIDGEADELAGTRTPVAS